MTPVEDQKGWKIAKKKKKSKFQGFVKQRFLYAVKCYMFWLFISWWIIKSSNINRLYTLNGENTKWTSLNVCLLFRCSGRTASSPVTAIHRARRWTASSAASRWPTRRSTSGPTSCQPGACNDIFGFESKPRLNQLTVVHARLNISGSVQVWIIIS